MPIIPDALKEALEHHQAGRRREAETLYREVLAHDPRNADALRLLGMLACESGQHSIATSYLAEAIHINPRVAPFHNNLGAVLEAQRRFADALLCFEQALRLEPDNAEAHNNLGNAQQARGQLEEAEACYREALRLDPNHASAHNNLGNVLRAQGHPREALTCYRKALRCQPDRADAHWNASQVLLLLGDFEAGWREYGWRPRVRSVAPRQFSEPPWDGSALAGRTILLHAEQGLGDAIQFVRYAPLVHQRGGKVMLECPLQLMRVFARAGGIDQLIPAGAPPPACDVQASLLDLPMIFGTKLKTIPTQVPYLECDPGLVAEWRDKIAQRSRRAVGLVWAGNPGHAGNRIRSLRLWELAPLGQVPGVDFFSLQRGPQAADILNPPPGLHLTALAPKATGFADAPAIANLDLVITVDTAVAHLAGALARPVWTLLPFAPDWRWLLDREDSPWYPTMRLFRQPRPGDWEAVIKKVVERLTDVVHS